MINIVVTSKPVDGLLYYSYEYCDMLNNAGVPDLDSLKDYNKENNTALTERDFNTTTLVYEHPDLKKMLVTLHELLLSVTENIISVTM